MLFDIPAKEYFSPNWPELLVERRDARLVPWLAVELFSFCQEGLGLRLQLRYTDMKLLHRFKAVTGEVIHHTDALVQLLQIALQGKAILWFYTPATGPDTHTPEVIEVQRPQPAQGERRPQRGRAQVGTPKPHIAAPPG